MENLRSIAGICRASGVKLVFVANQSTWNSRADTGTTSRHWLPTCGNVRYQEEYLSNGLDSFNARMQETAAEMNVPFSTFPPKFPKPGNTFTTIVISMCRVHERPVRRLLHSCQNEKY